MKNTSRIAQLKQEVETLTLRMQFFHLDPKWNNFKEICACRKLCNEQGHVIELWRLGCLAEYGEWWAGQYDDPLLNQTARGENLCKYSEQVEDLLSRIVKRPTSTMLDKIWYLFFATGNYNFLETAFHVGGNRQCKPGLRDDAVIMFDTIRSQYAQKIEETEKRQPDYFETHELNIVRNAPNVWKRFSDELENANAELNKMNPVSDKEIEELLAEHKQYEFVANEDSKYTQEERRRKKKVEHGMDIFENILRKLNKP